MFRKPFFLIHLVLLALTLPVKADTIRQLGWIERVQAPQDGYYVERAGQKRTLTPLAPLFLGDTVVVTDKHATLSLMVNGKQVKIDSVLSPFKVVPEEEPGLLSNLSQKVASLLWTDSSTRDVGAISRGRGLSISGLNSISPLVQSRDSLHFAWQNGVPPFTLILTNAETDAQLYEVTTSDQSVQLATASGLPNDVLVTLSDSNQQLRYTLQTIAQDQLPPVPDSLITDQTPVETASVLYSVWLYEQEDGDWQFEALQQLSLQANEGNPLAIEVLKSLRQ